MRDPSRQVVVTGAGLCCNLGDDRDKVTTALRTGDVRGQFREYEAAVGLETRCKIIGPYDGDVSDEALGIRRAQGRFLGRASRMALRAARESLAESGLEGNDFAVIVGSGTGDTSTHVEIEQRLAKDGNAKRVLPTLIPRMMSSTVSANLANVLRATGPSFNAVAACAGGAYNILLASELIEHGHVEAAVAGGVEANHLHFFLGFDAMRAYNRGDNDHPERASRPYAEDRAGFIFSEGAGTVVLETRAAAEARGAIILGVIRGYGMSSDGNGEMVAPAKDGAQKAMLSALRHAGVGPEEIDYINTHGTSTPLGDISEVRAIREVFNDRVVPYSSIKWATGHSVSGAGAIEAIVTMTMLRDGWIAPSMNAEPLDPELEDYAPVREPMDRELSRALSNSFGFGGTNVSLVLERP